MDACRHGRATLDGTNDERFRQALGCALHACRLLEAHLAADDPLTFNRQESELVINDRALAPNTDATYTSCNPEFASFLAGVLGHSDFSLTHQSDPRSLFGVNVKLAKPYDAAELLDALPVKP